MGSVYPGDVGYEEMIINAVLQESLEDVLLSGMADGLVDITEDALVSSCEESGLNVASPYSQGTEDYDYYCINEILPYFTPNWENADDLGGRDAPLYTLMIVDIGMSSLYYMGYNGLPGLAENEYLYATNQAYDQSSQDLYHAILIDLGLLQLKGTTTAFLNGTTSEAFNRTLIEIATEISEAPVYDPDTTEYENVMIEFGLNEIGTNMTVLQGRYSSVYNMTMIDFALQETVNMTFQDCCNSNLSNPTFVAIAIESAINSDTVSPGQDDFYTQSLGGSRDSTEYAVFERESQNQNVLNRKRKSLELCSTQCSYSNTGTKIGQSVLHYTRLRAVLWCLTDTTRQQRKDIKAP